MEEIKNITDVLVQSSRLVSEGKLEDAQEYLRRMARKNVRKSGSSVWLTVNGFFAEGPHPVSPTRSFKASTSVFAESPLVQAEGYPVALPVEPIWSDALDNAFKQVIAEWMEKGKLEKKGLRAANKLLFSGRPGVGKTLAAKWLGNRLKLPVLTLNLASVMSSFLGKTGNNLQEVFLTAKHQPCVLLLDEFDSIAKKRDDLTEIGELKRLVTVLLQEIDNWSGDSLLIAATNHQELLDPAVWRRFDVTLTFEKPEAKQLLDVIALYLADDVKKAQNIIPALAIFFSNYSHSDIQRSIQQIRKNAILNRKTITDEIVQYISQHMRGCTKEECLNLAVLLVDAGLSQRTASEMTGVSRDTIRKRRLRTNE